MRKSWGLTKLILTGQKTIESRWYKTKYPPWDKIKAGESVYFKDSGSPVTIKAEVADVKQFSDLTPEQVKSTLYKYGKKDGIDDIPKFSNLFKDRKYCILVFLKNPQKVMPFNIDKSGFGMMSAWLCVEDVNKIKRTNI
ncbi:hypothetical protein KY329_04815 [Candidatus Woesearchaeota archaeon]|nr:hypothetical protein [Candidatus Woesearchaeota archaeon]